MNSALRLRLGWWLMVVVCAGASAASAMLVYRGEWRQFGGFLWGLHAAWKSPGYRSTYLSRWVLPLALSYAILLCGGIFLGLRKWKRGAR